MNCRDASMMLMSLDPWWCVVSWGDWECNKAWASTKLVSAMSCTNSLWGWWLQHLCWHWDIEAHHVGVVTIGLLVVWDCQWTAVLVWVGCGFWITEFCTVGHTLCWLQAWVVWGWFSIQMQWFICCGWVLAFWCMTIFQAQRDWILCQLLMQSIIWVQQWVIYKMKIHWNKGGLL